MEFIIGGVAGAGATLFTNPMDVVKTRQQLQGELRARHQHAVRYRGVLRGMYFIARTEGLMALQNGLVPAMISEFALNSVRLGTYHVAEQRGWTRNDAGKVTLPRSALWGGIGGYLSGWSSNPMIVVKTRLQASAHPSIAVGKQHGYTGTRDAMASIYTHEGVRGFFAGVSANCARICIGSAAQLSAFEMSKQLLLSYGFLTQSPLGLTFWGSAVGGVVVSIVGCPLEVVTVRLYNQGVSKDGAKIYNGFIDCFRKVYRIEGLYGFYKGLMPFYFRIAPHTTVSLVIWDGLKDLSQNKKR